MTYKIRAGALTEAVSTKERSVSAPWFLDFQGQPIDLPIKPGEVGVYLEDAQILHIRNEQIGRSRTVTPTIDVTVDHEECFFDLHFRDLDDRLRFMPSVTIDAQGLAFTSAGGMEGYTFSNRAMFATFCAFMASPIYNPFEKPIPVTGEGLCGDVQRQQLFYRPFGPDELDDEDEDEDEDEIDPYLGREHEYPIDEKYCYLLSFAVETDRPIAVWDKMDRKDALLPPGLYHCMVSRWNRETGEPERIKLEGKSKTGEWVTESHLDWAVLATELELGHGSVANTKEREPFDPSHYRPVAPTGLLAAKPLAQKTAASGEVVKGLRALASKWFSR